MLHFYRLDGAFSGDARTVGRVDVFVKPAAGRPRQPVPNPRRRSTLLQPAQHNGAPFFSYALAQTIPGTTDVISDDTITLSPQ